MGKRQNDHDWPAELEKGAECYNCGLDYAEWTDPDTLWCEAEPR